MADLLPLWPADALGADATYDTEQDHFFDQPERHRVVRNVTRPSLTIYLPEPELANGTAVVVCPGGAHHFLAVDHEGEDVARWLNARGIAAGVLRYRVISTPSSESYFLGYMAQFGQSGEIRERMREHGPIAIEDGRQAIRLFRQHAAEWGVAPDRIGIMGFSAGAHVTAGVALEHDEESHPAFAAPIYGGIWDGEITASADAPPIFLAFAHDDPIAVEPGQRLYRAWQAAGVRAELHIFARGGHGFGMRTQGLPSDQWIDLLYAWLKSEGFAEPLSRTAS